MTEVKELKRIILVSVLSLETIGLNDSFVAELTGDENNPLEYDLTRFTGKIIRIHRKDDGLLFEGLFAGINLLIPGMQFRSKTLSVPKIGEDIMRTIYDAGKNNMGEQAIPFGIAIIALPFNKLKIVDLKMDS